MKEFLWPVRVYYEDTDIGGVVYYANYLKYMERARTEWLRSMGFEQDELIARHGVIFAVRSVQLEYRLPARFNEQLNVSLKVIRPGKASIVFRQEIRCQADDRLLCDGVIKIASLNAEKFSACAMPETLRKKITQQIQPEGGMV